jgi:epoxyqueuosine reductase QueG
MSELKEKISQICPTDLYEVGYASLAGLLDSAYADYPYGISLARKLDDSIIDQIKSGPTENYYNHYIQINHELNSKTKEIVEFLTSMNIEAFAIQATVEKSDLDESFQKTLRYSFSHKMAATRAGIGWIGKTSLLITERFGPRVRLASILTKEAVAEAGTPVDEGRCGKCDMCVYECPVRAATGQVWSVGIDRNKFFDAFKCRDFCREISEKNIQKKISLCGICISVCPQGG